jgi:hypothetical protein
MGAYRAANNMRHITRQVQLTIRLGQVILCAIAVAIAVAKAGGKNEYF